MTSTSTNPTAVPATSSKNNSRIHCPLWEMTTEQLNEFQVTPLSKYRDTVWRTQPNTPGYAERKGSFNWAMKFPDGSILTDPQHALRLDWSMKLMALIMHAPASGQAPAALSIPAYRLGFNMFLSWMIEQALHRPEELTTQIIENYIDDLPRIIAERSDDGDGEITECQVTRALTILPHLWKERELMAKWGISTSLDTDPFYKRGIYSYAGIIATKARGWIPPLPDEVAVPLFNKAAWFLGEPAEDVIELVNYVTNDEISGQPIVVQTPQSSKGFRVQEAGKNKQARLNRVNQFLNEFKFRTLPDNEAPWHPALNKDYEVANNTTAIRRLRDLYEAVRNACAITIQGGSGMRISELLGIEAGFDEDTGLPKGVRIETSASGLYELFLIKTLLSKTEKGMPREVDWILGMRQEGNTDEPLGVRALRILNRIQAPWRENATTPLLLLSDVNAVTLPPKTKVLGPISYDNISQDIKSFVEHWVDLSMLPDQSNHAISDNDLIPWRESNGRCITSHMLRKSWAQFVFAVHPRLMPAIALQFHHLSIAMTDSGYIGNNPLVASTMNEVAEQNRYNLMFEAVMGKGILAGKMGEQIEEATKNLAQEVKDLPVSEAYKRVRRYCDDVDLKVFSGPHGNCCPVNTSKMRCHDEAGIPTTMRQQPNYATRQPSLCAGCDCFILDEQHVPFWQDRYVENQIAYQQAKARGLDHGFRSIKERGVQAGKLLKAIRVDLAPLDLQVKQALVDNDNVVI